MLDQTDPPGLVKRGGESGLDNHLHGRREVLAFVTKLLQHPDHFRRFTQPALPYQSKHRPGEDLYKIDEGGFVGFHEQGFAENQEDIGEHLGRFLDRNLLEQRLPLFL